MTMVMWQLNRQRSDRGCNQIDVFGGGRWTVKEPLAKKGGENEERQEEVGRYEV